MPHAVDLLLFSSFLGISLLDLMQNVAANYSIVDFLLDVFPRVSTGKI